VAVHKRRPQSVGEGGLSSADILLTRGAASSDLDVRNFWSINFGFFNFLVCPHGQGGSFFAILCGRL